VATDEGAVPLLVSTLSLASYAATAATGAEPRAVGWASQVVFEALDSATPDVPRPQVMDAVAREAHFVAYWSHPLVSAEVDRERLDLADLLAAASAPEAVAEVRRRAAQEPMLG
jgi:hypothetical protein